MVKHIKFSDLWDGLYSDFTSKWDRATSDGSYRGELGLSSPACIIKYNCETQFIQVRGTIPRKPEDQNSHQVEIGDQLEVMCLIQIIEFIMRTISRVVDICDDISSLRWALINPESVTLIWKQAYSFPFVWCLSLNWIRKNVGACLWTSKYTKFCFNLVTLSTSQRTTECIRIINHGIIITLEGTKNLTRGRIFRLIRDIKLIHSRSSSPFQSHPVDCLWNL